MQAAEPRRLTLIIVLAAAAALLASQNPPATAADDLPEDSGYAIRGRVIDFVDESPLVNAELRLFALRGQLEPPQAIAHARSDAKGAFEFAELEPPRHDESRDHLSYWIVADAEGRPWAMHTSWLPPGAKGHEIRVVREQGVLSGQVVDADGRPVAGAAVNQFGLSNSRSIPGVLSTITDDEGRFRIERLPIVTIQGRTFPTRFEVEHRDHPLAARSIEKLPAKLTVKLQRGGIFSGEVVDDETGEPAAGAVVTAESTAAPRPTAMGADIAEYMSDEQPRTRLVATDAAGKFRVAMPAGQYNIRVEAPDRVCVALTEQNVVAKQALELPRFTLIEGGYIIGRVVNTRTEKTLSNTEQGEPITIGLIGPSHPLAGVISPTAATTVDATGRFILQAPPGENFPYFVNIRGQRMAWDTQKQPAVVVEEGQTTKYDMLITPPLSAQEKLELARKAVAKLPAVAEKRVERILQELKSQKKTEMLYDENTELWAMLLKELVAVGPEAVPLICQELDATVDDIEIRQAAFALRTIGDPRAVPALVRALPKCPRLPPRSDYGLIVEDADLRAFIQQHDLAQVGGQYVSFGRSVREISASLHKLTGENLGEEKLYQLHSSDDVQEQRTNQTRFDEQAMRWVQWWNEHGPTLVDDPAYQAIELPAK